MKKPSSIVALLGATAIMGVIMYADNRLPPQLVVSLFMVFPIAAASWYIGRMAALLLVGAAVIVRFVIEEGTLAGGLMDAVPYWNVAIRLTLYIFIIHIMSALRQAFERERSLASTDDLTGARNRRSFVETAALEIERASRYGHPFAVAYIDIVDFKSVNDRFGHAAGDAVLRLAVQTMRANLRSADSVARLGGDEFVLLLPETGSEAAGAAIRKVQAKIIEAAAQHGWPVRLSIGLVVYVKPPASVEEMVRAADHLMYEAKAQGGNVILTRIVGGRTRLAAVT